MKDIALLSVFLVAASAVAEPYRFVAFNIWGNYFGNPPEERAGTQAEILGEYEPDFIALQEMTADFWSSRLITDMTNRYETVGKAMGPNGNDAHVPVLYRRNRFELLDKGAKWFCKELDGSKGVVWAALKDRKTGERIVVFASHFWWRNDGEGDDYIRLDNARQLYAEVQAAAARYDAAVVGGGDLNAGGSSSALRELNRLGWRDAQETTPGLDSRLTWHGEPERNRRTGRYEGVPAERSKKRACTLDHIFYAPDCVRAREFRVDTRQKSLDVSDHSPIVFDFVLHPKMVWSDPKQTRSLEPVPQSSDTNHWWVKRFKQKQSEIYWDRDVVFIGDSITHYWESTGRVQWEKYFAGAPYNAFNLGCSADRTEHVLWRIENGQLDGYKAKAIVLMIGTNNTGHFPIEEMPPIDVIVGVRAVINAIRARQRDARIILHPIFPRGAKPDDPRRIRNDIVNHELCKLADGRFVIWCDFNDLLLNAGGTLSPEIMPDFLHPAAGGYEIWANAVLPIIAEILRTKPGDPVAGRFVCQPTAQKRGTPKACIPTSRFDISGTRGKWWWANRLKEKRNEIAASGGEFDVVMVGDSITHFWEDFNYWSEGLDVFESMKKNYRLLNLGYGGDHTENVLWRLQNGELDGYKAKIFTLMIGTNNRDKPEDTAAGVRKILDLIALKHPEAKTLLLPIFPRGKPGDKNRARNEEVNGIIRGFADGDKVIWHDINSCFLEDGGVIKAGAFLSDLLHPRRLGYEIWRDAMLPQFKRICGK